MMANDLMDLGTFPRLLLKPLAPPRILWALKEAHALARHPSALRQASLGSHP